MHICVQLDSAKSMLANADIVQTLALISDEEVVWAHNSVCFPPRPLFSYLSCSHYSLAVHSFLRVLAPSPKTPHPVSISREGRAPTVRPLLSQAFNYERYVMLLSFDSKNPRTYCAQNKKIAAYTPLIAMFVRFSSQLHHMTQFSPAKRHAIKAALPSLLCVSNSPMCAFPSPAPPTSCAPISSRPSAHSCAPLISDFAAQRDGSEPEAPEPEAPEPEQAPPSAIQASPDLSPAPPTSPPAAAPESFVRIGSDGPKKLRAAATQVTTYTG